MPRSRWSARRGNSPTRRLEAMAAAGVNRVSLGVQSFVDAEAHASGRLHSRAMVETDLRRLRAAGIANLNVDLIAGLAGQTVRLVGGVAGGACRFRRAPCQRVHAGGRRGFAPGARDAEAAERDTTPGWCRATMPLRACTSARLSGLSTAGLRQYEISNFAQPGFESRHNLRYWQTAALSGRGAGCVVDASVRPHPGGKPNDAARVGHPQPCASRDDDRRSESVSRRDGQSWRRTGLNPRANTRKPGSWD